MKKIISLCLAAILLLSVCIPTVLAAEGSGTENVSPDALAAQALYDAGMFRGTADGFELERAPSRLEAAVMFVRLYGAEDAAKSAYEAGETAHPFQDVAAWGAPYVAWLYTNGLTRGVSQTAFGAARKCTAKEYAAFLLRALGWQDGTDFAYADTLAFAAKQGLSCDGFYGGTFLRGDLALMSWFALFCKEKGGEQTLLHTLTERGVVTEEAERTLGSEQQKRGVSLCEDGLLLDAAKWRQVSANMDLSVRFEGVQDEDGEAAVEKLSLSSLTQTQPDGRVCVRTDRLRELIASWADPYTATGVPFRFDSYVKGMTEIDFLICDYRLDSDALLQMLLRQLMSGQSAVLDAPVGCYRGGARFDLGDTYVEVDFDNQQLTFFKNGKMLLNSNVVTGRLRGRETPTGLYYSHNKLRNCTLTGSDFCVFVKYWISIIYDVIGFHDASWRTEFGGDCYVNDGSHGCINVPEENMRILFANLDDGTPVLMYGENRWYEPGSDDSPATKNLLRGQTAVDPVTPEG